MNSQQAADWLGIKVDTLYAYVSRGLVRGQPGPGGRGRVYRRQDLEGLRARSAGPAAQALRFGEPVLDTRITQMGPQGPAYRGQPATALAAAGQPFEAVAELLWTGTLPARAPRWPAAATALPLRDLSRLLPTGSSPLSALALVLPVLAAADPQRNDRSPKAVLARARGLIPQLAASFALVLDHRRAAAALATADPVQALALALGVPLQPQPLDLLRCALILVADHELNASTFAARVAASTGADLYACLSAALATVSGPRHGGASAQAEPLARAAGLPAGAAAVVAHHLQWGNGLPGFGHPLYPQGDPRAMPLLAAAQALAPRSVRLRTLLALAQAMAEAGKPPPNVDLGLAATCAALKLKPGLGPALFAIGRCAGWVAHVLEQYESPAVLRPRARFVDEGP